MHHPFGRREFLTAAAQVGTVLSVSFDRGMLAARESARHATGAEERGRGRSRRAPHVRGRPAGARDSPGRSGVRVGAARLELGRATAPRKASIVSQLGGRMLGCIRLRRAAGCLTGLGATPSSSSIRKEERLATPATLATRPPSPVGDDRQASDPNRVARSQKSLVK